MPKSHKYTVRNTVYWAPCAYCNGVADVLDHIEPQSDGHKEKMNLVAACNRCNSLKGCVPLLLFLTWQAQSIAVWKNNKSYGNCDTLLLNSLIEFEAECVLSDYYSIANIPGLTKEEVHSYDDMTDEEVKTTHDAFWKELQELNGKTSV